MQGHSDIHNINSLKESGMSLTADREVLTLFPSVNQNQWPRLHSG